MTAQDDPYVRVYYRALTDEKFRGLSSAAWGHWVRLLVVADGMYPSAAPLPRWVEDGPLAELSAATIVDLLEGDYFLIHGMEPERQRRADAAAYAADVKHHGKDEADRRKAARAAGASDRMQPQPTGRPQQPNRPPGAASPLLSSPSLSTPIHAVPDARDGEPSEPYRTLEELTGNFPVQRVEPNAIRTLDALCDRRGIPAVLAALRAEAPGIDPQPPAPWPLIAAVRNRLEPFAGSKPSAPAAKGMVQDIADIRRQLDAG